MSKSPRDAHASDEWIWPDTPEPEGAAGLPPLPRSRRPEWSEAPTEPNLPALRPQAVRRARSAPEWPVAGRRRAAASAADRLLRGAEERQFSLRWGVVAAILVLGTFVVAAASSGIPFFGGNARQPNGVQANPLATIMPTATATMLPTATSTTAPTLTPAATVAPTVTAAPTQAATATPGDTPSPVATATPQLTPSASPSPQATAGTSPTP